MWKSLDQRKNLRTICNQVGARILVVQVWLFNVTMAYCLFHSIWNNSIYSNVCHKYRGIFVYRKEVIGCCITLCKTLKKTCSNTYSHNNYCSRPCTCHMKFVITVYTVILSVFTLLPLYVCFYRSAKRATSYPLMGGIGSSEWSIGGHSPHRTSTRLPSDKLWQSMSYNESSHFCCWKTFQRDKQSSGLEELNLGETPYTVYP